MGPKTNARSRLWRTGATFAVVDLLLQYGAKIEQSKALHVAAPSRKDDSECIPMMEYLLDHGADINALKHQSNPEYLERMKTNKRLAFGNPLHCAAKCGKKKRVKFLLERGADQGVRNTKGWTPADWVNEDDETGISEPPENYSNVGAYGLSFLDEAIVSGPSKHPGGLVETSGGSDRSSAVPYAVG